MCLIQRGDVRISEWKYFENTEVILIQITSGFLRLSVRCWGQMATSYFHSNKCIYKVLPKAGSSTNLHTINMLLHWTLSGPLEGQKLKPNITVVWCDSWSMTQTNLNYGSEYLFYWIWMLSFVSEFWNQLTHYTQENWMYETKQDNNKQKNIVSNNWSS